MTYITVEGIDGSGKSTLVSGLAREYPGAMMTVEPNEGLWTGDAVREALRRDTSPMTDAFLFMADRAEHLHQVVKPHLEHGDMVISDRGADSTYAYQALRVADAVPDPIEWFDSCYEYWDVEPDVTIWLDVDLNTAMGRLDGGEKYEKREMLSKVKRNYERLNMKHSERYHRIDATQTEQQVLDDAMAVIEEARQ